VGSSLARTILDVGVTTRLHRGTSLTLVALFRASHLPPTVAVTAIAAALATSVGRGWGVLAVAAAVFCGQLSVGWSNDYIDRHRDRDSGRLDKPIVANQVSAATVRLAALLALVACVPLSLLSGWRAGLLHIGAVLAALAYNVGIKATVLSPVPYILAFGTLPAFVTLGLPGHPWPPWWALGASAALGCGGHFVNTLGDIDDDLTSGVLGLPQRLGAKWSLRVGVSLLAIAVVVLTFAPAGRPNFGVVSLFVISIGLIGGVAVSASRGLSRLAWPLTIATAISAVVLLVASGSSLA
jgi:4-hydroxybenzoate polyprenyltransferase